jgi:Flp pilus assembly protein TadD
MTLDYRLELQKAVGAFSEGRYPVAEAICRRLVESDAHQAQPWFLLGMALTRQGAHEEAFQCLQRSAHGRGVAPGDVRRTIYGRLTVE